MKLGQLRRRTGGLIDRRGQGGTSGIPGFGLGSGGSGFPVPIPGSAGGRGLGLGGIVLILVILFVIFVLPQLLGGGSGTSGLDQFPGVGGAGGTMTEVDPNDQTGDFVDAVGDDVQITWEEVFAAGGQTYEPTRIVLFSGSTSTACGPGTAQTGPFYCPLDQMVYLDHSFFDELERRFGASGDFAEAYVIAHEIGHHVQTVLGISGQVEQARRQDPGSANVISIRQELQADCLAGIWGHSANQRGVLEPGDVEEGLAAAAAVGDDRIQASVSGRIAPESWTHGSAEQRARWLQRGLDSGSPAACDTFAVGADQL
jgi:predicted metalloprotease